MKDRIFTAAFCLITLFLTVSSVALTDSNPTKPASLKTLHFPKNKSFGLLYIEDNLDHYTRHHTDQGWEFYSEAMGDVKVNASKRFSLRVNFRGVETLSALSKLGKNDLYQLSISGYSTPIDPNQTVAIMAEISKLSGLKALYLPKDITDDAFSFITKLKSLKELTVNSRKLTDAGIANISQLKKLEELSLTADNITDEGLRNIAQLESLKKLTFICPAVKGTGLSYIAKMPALKTLILRGVPSFGGRTFNTPGNRFTGKELFHLSNSKSITSLDLYHLKVTDADMAALSPMAQLEQLHLVNTPITNAGLLHLKKFKMLKELTLRSTKIDDEGLAQLKDIISLEKLSLPPESITDKGLRSISSLNNLKHLEVMSSHDRITDRGLEQLSKLKSLEELHIGGNGLTDSAMKSISKLDNLKRLFIIAPITNEGLSYITSLKSLQRLTLRNTKVSLAGINQLNSMGNLIEIDTGRTSSLSVERLDIRNLKKLKWLLLGNGLTDEDLAYLADLKTLEWLSAGNTNISNDGIKHLSGLTKLEALRFDRTKITDEGLAHLADLEGLARLSISGRFTDAGLKNLTGHKALRILNVRSDKQFSTSAVEHLKDNLPYTLNCFITPIEK